MSETGRRLLPWGSAAELRHVARVLADHRARRASAQAGAEPEESRAPTPRRGAPPASTWDEGSIGQPPVHVIRALDPDARRLALLLADALDQPQAEVIARALGVDGPTLRARVEQQELALQALQQVWTLREATYRGGRLVNRARSLARALIRAELQARLMDATEDAVRDSAGATELAEDSRTFLEALRRRPRPGLAPGLRRPGAEARVWPALAFASQRTSIQALLRRVRDQETPDWDLLGRAATACARLAPDPQHQKTAKAPTRQ